MQNRRRRQTRSGRARPAPSSSRLIVRMGRQGFADSIRTTITYSDIIALSPASTIGQYTFRGNSAFDPDYTSTGHQPLYFDQLAAPYERYRVYASSITVQAVNEQVGSALMLTVIPASEITTFTTSVYPLEIPYARGARLIGVGGIFTAKVQHHMSTSKILGLRPREILDQDYSALKGANPSSIWYWQLVVQNLSAENILTSLQVIITYDVEFYDRASVLPSFSNPEMIPKEQRTQLTECLPLPQAPPQVNYPPGGPRVDGPPGRARDLRCARSSALGLTPT